MISLCKHCNCMASSVKSLEAITHSLKFSSNWYLRTIFAFSLYNIHTGLLHAVDNIMTVVSVLQMVYGV